MGVKNNTMDGLYEVRKIEKSYILEKDSDNYLV